VLIWQVAVFAAPTQAIFRKRVRCPMELPCVDDTADIMEAPTPPIFPEGILAVIIAIWP
jgi:hypothetical protein